jgi:hypothetical protein
MTNLNCRLSSLSRAVRDQLQCDQQMKRHMHVHTWEAVQVDSPQEVEELNTMLGELRKVLVDHIKSALEHILHDNWDLVLHKVLQRDSAFKPQHS